MEFNEPLIEATLVRRHRRFLADIRLSTGEEVTAHCVNPGSMKGISEPGSKVLVSMADDPRRKFDHSLEIIYSGKTPVAVHTGRPNVMVAEAIAAGNIPEMLGYSHMRRDVHYGRNSRIDILLEGNGLRSAYIEVKNVTMAENGIALYPDVVSEAATEQLGQLVDMVRRGNRGVMFFVATRGDVEIFRPADRIDPVYCQALRDAAARGVEVTCYRARVTPTSLQLEMPLQVDLSEI